jgi:hypothetical protein
MTKMMIMLRQPIPHPISHGFFGDGCGVTGASDSIGSNSAIVNPPMNDDFPLQQTCNIHYKRISAFNKVQDIPHATCYAFPSRQSKNHRCLAILANQKYESLTPVAISSPPSPLGFCPNSTLKSLLHKSISLFK